MADSRLRKLFLQLIFVTLSRSTMIALSFLELAEEDCFGHAYVFHPCDVASPAKLHLKQDELYAGQAGSLEDFFVRHVVLLLDATFKYVFPRPIVTIPMARSVTAPAQINKYCHETHGTASPG